MRCFVLSIDLEKIHYVAGEANNNIEIIKGI